MQQCFAGKGIPTITADMAKAKANIAKAAADKAVADADEALARTSATFAHQKLANDVICCKCNAAHDCAPNSTRR
jgi:hypothetical protein